MTSNQPVILLTGRPGIGKTTVIKKIVSLLGSNTGGFYTREIRQQGKRTGFEIVTLDGLTETLATTEATVVAGRRLPLSLTGISWSTCSVPPTANPLPFLSQS
jgi:nucleoside-triphosphatase THEP1